MRMNKEDTDFILGVTQDKNDPELGWKIHEHLKSVGLENPYTTMEEHRNPKMALDALHQGIETGLAALGFDREDPSMADTPRRFAAMFVGELTRGLDYNLFPKCTATPATGLGNLVVQRNLVTMSLCEHHLQTIDGFTHVAYIPKTKLLGLSKFARVVEFFSRRPQVQERLTAQIYETLCHILETDDVAVVTVAKHYCMKARGALQHASDTTTDKMGGKFFHNPTLRAEFLNRISAGE